MKRTGVITGDTATGKVRVAISISDTAGLTGFEVDVALHDLMDASMRSIAALRYFQVPLSQQKVGR